MKLKAIRGFKDILPEEAALWRKLENKAVDIAALFDFEEFRIPILEKTALFARTIGQDTDIVEKEMFSFPDRHDELLSLRPEATAGMVRALIEHKLSGDGRPLKYFTIGPIFRYERPQKGRQRQFHQFNVEVFNAKEAAMDAEIITLFATILESAGLDDLTIHLNTLGCSDCRKNYNKELQAFLTSRKKDLCPDCERRLANNPLRVLDCKNPACGEAVQDAPLTVDNLCLKCQDHFDETRSLLDQAKVQYLADPKLVRGLDYYTRTVFEGRSDRLGAQSAVGGGGRYDALVKSLGGPDVPGIGFGIGLERLIMLLQEDKKSPKPAPEIFIVNLTKEATTKAFGLAQELRKNGIRVSFEYAPASMKSKMRRAQKLAAEKVLILGPDEIEKGIIILKTMESGEQESIPEGEAVQKILKLADLL